MVNAGSNPALPICRVKGSHPRRMGGIHGGAGKGGPRMNAMLNAMIIGLCICCFPFVAFITLGLLAAAIIYPLEWLGIIRKEAQDA